VSETFISIFMSVTLTHSRSYLMFDPRLQWQTSHAASGAATGHASIYHDDKTLDYSRIKAHRACNSTLNESVPGVCANLKKIDAALPLLESEAKGSHAHFDAVEDCSVR
jgi:hypothetical protein